MPIPVLLVEDSRAMRDFVVSILEQEGAFEVRQVENGFEALRELPRQPWGLILADINIPDISGIELIRFVRSHARHGATPVVAISTDASSVDVQRALDAGATCFLAKPFAAEDLRRVLREHGVGTSEAGGE